MCLTLWLHGLYSPWNSPGQNTGLGSLSLLQGIFPTEGSTPGLPHCRRILYQLSHRGSPRILEWVAYSFSRGSSQSKNQTGSPACTMMSFDSSQDGGDQKQFLSISCATGTVLNTLHSKTVTLTTTPWNKYCYHLHFTDEETEAREAAGV